MDANQANQYNTNYGTPLTFGSSKSTVHPTATPPKESDLYSTSEQNKAAWTLPVQPQETPVQPQQTPVQPQQTPVQPKQILVGCTAQRSPTQTDPFVVFAWICMIFVLVAIILLLVFAIDHVAPYAKVEGFVMGNCSTVSILWINNHTSCQCGKHCRYVLRTNLQIRVSLHSLHLY